jgi:hypothetical protein
LQLNGKTYDVEEFEYALHQLAGSEQRMAPGRCASERFSTGKPNEYF